MSIQERQNQPESLTKLAAQRLMYFRAKRMRNIGIVLILIVALMGLAASILDDSRVGHYFPLIALILWFIDQEVLKRTESSYKTEAAAIQEDFDCDVLKLPWPRFKNIQQPRPDRVKQLSLMASGNHNVADDLNDWYPPDNLTDDPAMCKVYCQRINCWWDVSLRQKWIRILKVLSWIFAVLVLILCVITGITVGKLIAIIATNIRVVAWIRGEIKDQAAAIERVDRIHGVISGFTAEKPPSPSDIRSIQDEIFEHRRSNSPVPDWFYWRDRERQENEAGTSSLGGES